MITPEYRECLQRALAAAQKAGNPYLVRSIMAALAGTPMTLQDALDDAFFIDDVDL